MKLQISNTRVAFAHGLFKASAFEEGQTPKYGCDFILTPSSKVYEVTKAADGSIKRTETTLKKAELAVADEAWKGKGKEMLENFEASKKAVRDGNKRLDKSGEVYDGYENSWYVTAKSASRPPLYDAEGNTTTEEDGVIYSGCFVHVSLDLYANTKPKTRGVFAGLTGVRFARDGDAFGGGGKASADDMAGLDGGADAEDLA
jgi:hypothetical protein